MLKYVNYDIVFQEIPDEVTLAINLSNCPNHCKGCHTPSLMGDIGEPLTVEVLDQLLANYGHEVTCFCFMGGDSAPSELVLFAAYLCLQKSTPVKVAWYSGKQELPQPFEISWFHYIKLGPYIEQLGGLKSRSTNQRLLKRTDNNELVDITYRFWQSSSC